MCLLLTLHFQQFGTFSRNVQYLAIRYPSCLCVLCVRVSGQVRSRDPAGLGGLVQMLLCACSLGLRSECQALCVFVVYRWVCVCLCVCVCISWVYGCVCVSCVMPALPRTAQLDSTREMWHKESTEQVRKSVSVLEVCVHFFYASLTAAANERGLVLLEQMAEC